MFEFSETDFVFGVQKLHKVQFITCIYKNKVEVHSIGKSKVFKGSIVASKLSKNDNVLRCCEKNNENPKDFCISDMKWDKYKSYKPDYNNTTWSVIEGVDFESLEKAIEKLNDFFSPDSRKHSCKLKSSSNENGNDNKNKNENEKTKEEDSEEKIEEEIEKDSSEEDTENVNLLYNNFMDKFKKNLDQVDKWKDGTTKMFELLNEHVPIMQSEVDITKTSKRKETKKFKVTQKWWNEYIPKFKNIFIEGVLAKKSATCDNSLNESFGNLGPNYRPDASTGYFLPCFFNKAAEGFWLRSNPNKKRKGYAKSDIAYHAGHFLDYYVKYHSTELRKKQERTKWDVVLRGEKCEVLGCADCGINFAPRWPSINEIAISAKFLISFAAKDRKYTPLIGNIFVLTSLTLNTTVGAVQIIRDGYEMHFMCKKDHREIKEYKNGFDEERSLVDKSKGCRSALGILNSGGKILLNGSALGFYVYAMFFSRDNKLMQLMATCSVLGCNIAGEAGHGLEDTVNICIDSQDNNKQLAPLQHCCTFGVKPIVSALADGISMAAMIMNHLDDGVVSDSTMLLVVLMLQLIKASFNYSSNVLANRSIQRNKDNAIFKIKKNPTRGSINFDFSNTKNNRTDIDEIKVIENKPKLESNETTPLLNGKNSKNTTIQQ